MGFDLPPIINDNCVALSINRSPSYDSCAVSSKHCIIKHIGNFTIAFA